MNYLVPHIRGINGFRHTDLTVLMPTVTETMDSLYDCESVTGFDCGSGAFEVMEPLQEMSGTITASLNRAEIGSESISLCTVVDDYGLIPVWENNWTQN